MRSSCHGEGNGADATLVVTTMGMRTATATKARRILLTAMKANGGIFRGSEIPEEVLLL